MDRMFLRIWIPRPTPPLAVQAPGPGSVAFNAWRNSLSNQAVIRALDYLNWLAVAGGRLNGKTDSLDDLRINLCDMPAPADV